MFLVRMYDIKDRIEYVLLLNKNIIKIKHFHFVKYLIILALLIQNMAIYNFLNVFEYFNKEKSNQAKFQLDWPDFFQCSPLNPRCMVRIAKLDMVSDLANMSIYV